MSQNRNLLEISLEKQIFDGTHASMMGKSEEKYTFCENYYFHVHFLKI